jgi:hypothetical protein
VLVTFSFCRPSPKEQDADSSLLSDPKSELIPLLIISKICFVNPCRVIDHGRETAHEFRCFRRTECAALTMSAGPRNAGDTLDLPVCNESRINEGIHCGIAFRRFFPS